MLTALPSGGSVRLNRRETYLLSEVSRRAESKRICAFPDCHDKPRKRGYMFCPNHQAMMVICKNNRELGSPGVKELVALFEKLKLDD